MQQNGEVLGDSTDFYISNELKAEKRGYPSLWFTLLYEKQGAQIKP